ncbi:S8 family peptidase [Thalassotalea castellviae]|uniref:S8 family serine peptidase n=1 Tax=Thalassotalea castellviae TaxID=3075612 RepID=A0ABU3A2H7_9GAMM|nr:S8 family serine peptidase [Thalassotalea sp. W431]MDT0604369.1 S8 family serine peptidase [Thalassotalea sp. W431]
MKNISVFSLLMLFYIPNCFAGIKKVEMISSTKIINAPIEQYIVVLKEPSIYEKINSSSKASTNNTKASQRFLARTNVILQQQKISAEINNKFKGKVVVSNQFQNLINAVVISASKSQVSQISLLKSVKRIDKVVYHKINATENVTDINVINADQVWSKEINGINVTGKNVTVGVLDTGIDYNHQDLGGCFGSDCKVYSGYDFVNDDDDPLDDESHGTHVSGIIAANGEIKGVAPDAKLLAVKVCNEHGFCSTTDIIEGLEFSLDPDGDPETNDAVDIVNMSIGSSSHDKALMETTNNIVKQGIVVVVAAGNDGPNTNTIGSPADAEKAITVAASNSNNSIADFSSRGFPSSGEPLLKPEVAAPGVSINSTLLDGKYGQRSGTSMASPMVAGVIALIKQHSPEKSPEQIKAALIATASPIVNDIQIEGSGLINALSAIELPININTPIISFGDSNFSEETFEVSVPVEFHNPSSNEVSFSLDLNEVSHSAITFQNSLSNLVIPANETITLDMSVNVDTNQLPISKGNPTYSTSLNFDIEGVTYHIPTILFHRSYIDIKFSNYAENYSDMKFFNSEVNIWKNIWSPNSLSDQTKRIFIAPGTYNIVDSASNERSNELREVAFLFYPNIELVNALTIEVSTEHAINKVLLNLEDPHGDKISGDVGIKNGMQKGVRLAMFDKTSGFIIENEWLPWSLNENQEATFSFTDIPEGYSFHLFSENNEHTPNPSENIAFAKEFNSPITQDINIDIKSEDFHKISLSYAQPSYLTSPYLLPFIYQKENIYAETALGGAVQIEFNDINDGRTLFITNMNDNFQFSYFSEQINNKQWTEEGHEILYSGPNFKVNENNQLALYNFFSDDVIKTYQQSDDYELTVGKLLPFWTGIVSKQENGQFVYNFTDNDSNAFFRDSHFSYWKDDISIITNNINENTISNRYVNIYQGGITQNITIPKQSGKIQTDISFDGYIIEDRQSNISTQLTFDLDREQFSPPSIKDLKINSLGKLTHQLHCGKGSISIELNKDIALDNLQLSIKSSDKTEREFPTIQKQNNLIVVDLSELLVGFYDLNFSAIDVNENSLTYSAEPAFHVTDYELLENDADCDDVLNDEDAFPLDPSEWLDTDGDTIGNNADNDDDNDGVIDSEDAFPLDDSESLDNDQDGIGNNADPDDDNDGVNDSEDAFPLDDSESIDTDDDGIGNNADPDDDNDGVNDSEDAYPLDSSRSKSTTILTNKSSSGGGGSIGVGLILLIILTSRYKIKS